MCQPNLPPPSGQDEFYVDDPELRTFIADVRQIVASHQPGPALIEALTPRFEALLRTPGWLPDHFMEPKEGSGMGSGIGMWLLYRSGDGALSFSSLVVPPGASTPVHDHLTWGLVGLYRGTQDEVVYRRTDDRRDEEHARLETLVRRQLTPGACYEILPETDIHQVTTTSDVTSVSLHLLGVDQGCMWRHRYEVEEQRVLPFKSGWLNVPCTENSGSDVDAQEEGAAR